MILKQILGENWGVMDRYATRAKHSRLLASSFGGDTVAERMREATALRSSRPNLRKFVGHIILSHDPELTDLTDEQWMVALEIARQEHDLRDAAYCAVLHLEKEHRHLHLYYVRCRPDGSVVSDSQSYRKNEAAARRIEQELGLPPPTPVPKEKKVGDRRRSDNATRRGRRKQQTKGENFMETTELSRLTFEAIAVSSSTESFKHELAARGIEPEWSANLAGVKFKPIGSSTWLKGSSIHRDLSALKITTALDRNADLRREARQVAEAAAASADDRAEARIANRIGRHGGEVKIAPDVAPARALAPVAAAAEQQRMQELQELAADPLSFLTPEPVRQDGVPNDDAELDAPPFDHARAARETAEAELDLELRKLEIGQLFDLKNFKIAPVLLTAEQLAALVNLMIRIASFGLLKMSNVFAEARTARELLSERAAAELQRRKRTPSGVVEKLKLLATEEAALGGRKTGLEARTSNFWRQTPRAVARGAVERRHDLDAVRAKAPTIAAHRGVVQDIDARLGARADEITEVEGRIPVGMAGVLLGATDAVRLARVRLARLKAQQRADNEKRARLALALELLIDDFEKKFQAQILAEEERVKAQRAAVAEEVEQLGLELRERIPAERREVERLGLAERQRGDDSSSVPCDRRG